METDLKLKKQVSSDQLNALVQFLKEHQELAKGLTRGRRGKLNTFKLWNLCAKKLNVLKDGATKDGKGWSKYWCDLKYRVRRRALEQRAAEQSNERNAENLTPLSTLEEEILNIIGQGSLDSVVIKMDPLAETEMDNIQESMEKKSGVDYSGTQPKLLNRKRHHTLIEIDNLDNLGESSCDKKPKISQNEDDSGHDDTSEFLRLEREKLEYVKKTSESLQAIAPALISLVDVMSHIRDVLVNNRVNL